MSCFRHWDGNTRKRKRGVTWGHYSGSGLELPKWTNCPMGSSWREKKTLSSFACLAQRCWLVMEHFHCNNIATAPHHTVSSEATGQPQPGVVKEKPCAAKDLRFKITPERKQWAGVSFQQRLKRPSASYWDPTVLPIWHWGKVTDIQLAVLVLLHAAHSCGYE